jgi:hypothetical protein
MSWKAVDNILCAVKPTLYVHVWNKISSILTSLCRIYLSVTSELRASSIEHVEGVEHQQDTNFKFWSFTHKEALQRDKSTAHEASIHTIIPIEKWSLKRVKHNTFKSYLIFDPVSLKALAYILASLKKIRNRHQIKETLCSCKYQVLDFEHVLKNLTMLPTALAIYIFTTLLDSIPSMF